MSKEVGTHLDREFIAAHRLIRLGYTLVALGEDQIRRVFEIPTNPFKQCADIIVTDRHGTCFVIECKGNDIGKAVSQLNVTIPYVQKVYARVEPQIITNAAAPRPGTPIVGIGPGYCAKYLKSCNTYVLVAAKGSADYQLKTGHTVEVRFDLQ